MASLAGSFARRGKSAAQATMRLVVRPVTNEQRTTNNEAFAEEDAASTTDPIESFRLRR
jgi:hypothetical protein